MKLNVGKPLFWGIASTAMLFLELLASTSIYSSILIYLQDMDYDSPMFGQLPIIKLVPFISNQRSSSIEAFMLTTLFLLTSHLFFLYGIKHFYQVQHSIKQGEKWKISDIVSYIPLLLLLVLTINFYVFYFDALSLQLGTNDFEELETSTISGFPFLVVILAISAMSATTEFRLVRCFASSHSTNSHSGVRSNRNTNPPDSASSQGNDDLSIKVDELF